MNYRRFYNRHRSKFYLLSIGFLTCYVLIAVQHRLLSQQFVDGFNRNDISNELERYNQLKHHYQLTGIVLHWQRLNGVQRLVHTMLEFDDLFPYIIVWNNNPKKNLTIEDLLVGNTSRITIVNSEVNIKDQAKYRSCQLAKTNACFYVDDDWDIKLYIRSLYASFLLEPTILHAITDQFTYFTNLMWTFFDESISLHAGFSWIGCGAVFSRDNAVRHLNYLQLFLDNDQNRDLLPQGDQFFSIWMNQMPAQFNGRLLHSDEGAASSFDNFDFGTIQHRASILSIETLEKSLRHSSNSDVFERTRASNVLVTYTKSTCSYNDKFIFFTNCLPIDHLEQIPFDIKTDITRGTRQNLPNSRNTLYRDRLRFFENFNTANAVDNDTKTCWKIDRPIRSGDLYGIDFQSIQIDGAPSFSIEYSHERSLQERLQISISLDSVQWSKLPAQDRRGIVYEQDKQIVHFHTHLFPAGFRIFRFIQFVSLSDEESSFHICEVREIKIYD